MAGDWLKVEKATPRKPEVLLLSVALNIHPDHAFGVCFRFWSWCDDQVSDGKINGLSESLIDATVDRPGFAQALISIGWLKVREGSLLIPNFDRHLSHSAKTRAEAAIRKRKTRTKPVTQMSQKNVTSVTESMDKNVTIEKRREEKKEDIPLSPFEQIINPTNGGTFLSHHDNEFRDFWEIVPDEMRTGIEGVWNLYQHVRFSISQEKNTTETLAASYLKSRFREFLASPKGRKKAFRMSIKTFLTDRCDTDQNEAWQIFDDSKSTADKKPKCLPLSKKTA